MALSACEQQVVYDVDYNVTLDPSNTYLAGEPVKFNFTGNVDNLLFYSGETGSQYIYRDRYVVPMENVIAATLDMSVLAQYGNANGMSIYLTDTFEGLSGNDGEADRATMKSLLDGGMQGWTKLEYVDSKSGVTTSFNEDISGYMDNFCVAFHWNPIRDGKSAQRTYKINGSVSIEMDGVEPATMDFSEMGFKILTMNEETDPYAKNKGNGYINDNKSGYVLTCQGCAATVLDYAIDAWAISTPTALNKVSNDKGTVIKDLQNYMDSYEYTWNEPGTYTVTFVGVNANYKATSTEIHEFTVTILENPDQDGETD